MKPRREGKYGIEIQNFDWLSEKYMLIYGLRDWTWRVIIDGVVCENMIYLGGSEKSSIDVRHIRLLWYTFLEVAGIDDLDRVPKIGNPNGPDIKAAMYMYSMESFLYKRINLIQREKVEQSILTLGPYAVALTKIISNAQ